MFLGGGIFITAAAEGTTMSQEAPQLPEFFAACNERSPVQFPGKSLTISTRSQSTDSQANTIILKNAEGAPGMVEKFDINLFHAKHVPIVG